MSRSVVGGCALVVSIVVAVSWVLAENVNPNNDGSKFAWAENIGWLNAQPLGPGGPGVEVEDFRLTGWIWSENAGWISLSCANDQSCSTASYGVINRDAGHLMGFAWAENSGWINFSPSTAGVLIDPGTGIFSGWAWSENAGWITFSSTGTNPYRVQTAWRCLAPSVPSDIPSLSVNKHGNDTVLMWSTPEQTTGFDVVRGDLALLKSTSGDFSQAAQACLAAKTTATSLTTGGTPSPGDGYWYLLRPANCRGIGSYNDGSQAGSRDAGIAASGSDCS